MTIFLFTLGYLVASLRSHKQSGRLEHEKVQTMFFCWSESGGLLVCGMLVFETLLLLSCSFAMAFSCYGRGGGGIVFRTHDTCNIWL